MKNRPLKTTVRLVINSLFAALCLVLSLINPIDTGFFKLTFESFPIFLAALLFGPVDGALVGFVGTFLGQILRYGLDASTILWVIPYVLSGLLVGLYAKARRYTFRIFELVIVGIINGILLTAVNTGMLFIYNVFLLKTEMHAAWASIIAALPMRILTNVAKGALFGTVSFFILPLIKGIYRKL